MQYKEEAVMLSEQERQSIEAGMSGPMPGRSDNAMIGLELKFDL